MDKQISCIDDVLHWHRESREDNWPEQPDDTEEIISCLEETKAAIKSLLLCFSDDEEDYVDYDYYKMMKRKFERLAESSGVNILKEKNGQG